MFVISLGAAKRTGTNRVHFRLDFQISQPWGFAKGCQLEDRALEEPWGYYPYLTHRLKPI